MASYFAHSEEDFRIPKRPHSSFGRFKRFLRRRERRPAHLPPPPLPRLRAIAIWVVHHCQCSEEARSGITEDQVPTQLTSDLGVSMTSINHYPSSTSQLLMPTWLYQLMNTMPIRTWFNKLWSSTSVADSLQVRTWRFTLIYLSWIVRHRCRIATQFAGCRGPLGCQPNCLDVLSRSFGIGAFLHHFCTFTVVRGHLQHAYKPSWAWWVAAWLGTGRLWSARYLAGLAEWISLILGRFLFILPAGSFFPLGFDTPGARILLIIFLLLTFFHSLYFFFKAREGVILAHYS